MARQTREEWLAGLKEGDRLSCTFPGDALPSIGTAEKVTGDTVLARFVGRDFLVHFEGGALLGAPECKLWMVATGSGGSVGPPVLVTNLIESIERRSAQAERDGR